MSIFGVYKRYPFAIPWRVKFFNLFRLVFRLAVLEKFLVSMIMNDNWSYWKKMIPPLYFYPKGSIRTVERDQIHYCLDISKQLDHSIYYFTVHDVAWQNLFQILCPHFKIIDVGANIGFLTLHFASRCRQGMVYSFEADSETFSRLSQNVSLNNFDNIMPFQMAIGDKPGTGQLYKMYESNPGANRILAEKPGDAVPSETVEISTLDEYESKGFFRGVDLIKIDVEGFELFVLYGARNLIIRWMPLLFVELVEQNLRSQGCSARSVIEYLRSFDYLILDAKTMTPLQESDCYYTDIMCFPRNTKKNYA